MQPDTDSGVKAHGRAALLSLAITGPITVGIWLAVYRLSPPLAGAEDPSRRASWALGWLCLAALLALLPGIEAVAHRRLFSAAIDPLAGAEAREIRVDLRYLGNTVEQFLIFAPGLLGLAWYARDGRTIHAVTATAIVWIVARWAFWIGYHRGSRFRAAGLTGMAQSMVVLLHVGWRFGHELAGPVGGTAPIALFLLIEARLFQLAWRDRNSPYTLNRNSITSPS